MGQVRIPIAWPSVTLGGPQADDLLWCSYAACACSRAACHVVCTADEFIETYRHMQHKIDQSTFTKVVHKYITQEQYKVRDGYIEARQVVFLKCL